MQSSAIFPLFYLPPVNYFTKLKLHDYSFLIEKEEHFVKQTYRNRASIASPNGKLDLFIPVVKGAKVHTLIKDVRISDDLKWQRLHWLSMQTCYRSSAYFEYYEDELKDFYHKKYDFLFDFNLELLNWLLKQIKVDAKIDFTIDYQKNVDSKQDYRTILSSKNSINPQQKNYFQVFDDRNGFMPNLSIIDLLFNQGPQTKLYL
ncbi:MAG: WbqC family protein [Sphingobacteriaceae bacterium]|nr:WbqC family protein [Sphingobacteriaceae bacterium]